VSNLLVEQCCNLARNSCSAEKFKCARDDALVPIDKYLNLLQIDNGLHMPGK
jgi:hypothetical protein